MSREEIIRMAREAGLLFAPETGAEWSAPIPGADYPLRLAAFAERVSAAEREACAVWAELVAREIDDTNGTATYIAEGIRARGQG